MTWFKYRKIKLSCFLVKLVEDKKFYFGHVVRCDSNIPNKKDPIAFVPLGTQNM